MWLAVIRDMEARRQFGLKKYGRPVHPHNGRNALQDAYEEQLDQAVYLRQALAEEPWRVGVAAIVMRGERLLVCQRTSQRCPGILTLAGGALEKGETFTQAAAREAMEEAGVLVQPFSEPAFTTCDPDLGGQPWVTVWMGCEWLKGEPERREPHKAACWVWLTPDEIYHAQQHLPDDDPAWYWMPLQRLRGVLADFNGRVDRERRRVQVGVSAIIVRDGKLLVAQRLTGRGAGAWACPGGKIEFGEEPVEAVLREVKQETGLAASCPPQPAFTTTDRQMDGAHVVTLWFPCEVAGEPENLEPQRHGPWVWRNRTWLEKLFQTVGTGDWRRQWLPLAKLRPLLETSWGSGST